MGKSVHGVNLKLGLGVALVYNCHFVHDPLQFASPVYTSLWHESDETASSTFRIVI
jgi:hypothetical protein